MHRTDALELALPLAGGRGRKAGDAREHVCRCGKAGDASLHLGGSARKRKTRALFTSGMPCQRDTALATCFASSLRLADMTNCGSGVPGLTTGGGWASEGRGRLNATGAREMEEVENENSMRKNLNSIPRGGFTVKSSDASKEKRMNTPP